MGSFKHFICSCICFWASAVGSAFLQLLPSPASSAATQTYDEVAYNTGTFPFDKYVQDESTSFEKTQAVSANDAALSVPAERLGFGQQKADIRQSKGTENEVAAVEAPKTPKRRLKGMKTFALGLLLMLTLLSAPHGGMNSAETTTEEKAAVAVMLVGVVRLISSFIAKQVDVSMVVYRDGTRRVVEYESSWIKDLVVNLVMLCMILFPALFIPGPMTLIMSLTGLLALPVFVAFLIWVVALGIMIELGYIIMGALVGLPVL